MNDDPCVSDLELDRLLGDELPLGERERVRAHIRYCSRCGVRFSSFEAEREAFRTHGPRLALPEPSRLGFQATAWMLAAGATSVALAVFLVQRAALPEPASVEAAGSAEVAGAWEYEVAVENIEPSEEAQPAGTRAKGGSSFELYIRHGESVRSAGDREPVHAGDQLQFAYSAERAGHVAVLSRDGAGAVDVYFPARRRQTWPAGAGQRQILPESTILDATPGSEQIYALFCEQALELEPLLRGLREAGSPPVVEGCSSRHIVLDKVP